MNDQQNSWGTQSGWREEVAYVCGKLDAIRATLEAHGSEGPAPLDRVLETLLRGEDPGAQLDYLHESLLTAGDAVGVHGRARGLKPNGIDTPAPDARVLLCPMDRCASHRWPDGSDAPLCHISGQPLRRERL
ncbi:hypothetical protein ABZS83_32055 [Streptomyces sp. NPDC005426]|uniref:hypothetical protein n=1 Tax=Streptomyces sp. NPDC005426 TaxID=3155344 RepID=UPI0033A6C500